jgi:MmyB-like transcription regulator ligand binding domain
VGLTWYTMFENGTAPGVSNELVERVADALRLTAGERMHLHSIATRGSLAWPEETVDPLLSEALHGWIDAPAYVITYSWDVVAWNAAYALVWDIAAGETAPFNLVLRFFSEARVQRIAGESWPELARALVGMFREHPLVDPTITVDSPHVGRFTYRVLNLNLVAPIQTLVIQVPIGDNAGEVRDRLRRLSRQI